MNRYASPRAILVLLACGAVAACGGGGGGAGGGGGPLDITSTDANDGVVGAPYSDTITASGGRGAKTFGIASGALPAGLSMSAAGAITGTPTGPAGAASFTVQVSDSAATPATDSRAFSIDIAEPLEIQTGALADTAVNDDYVASLAATGGKAPLSFRVSAGALPAGLALGAGGALTGRVLPSATTESFSVEVTDSSSPQLSDTRTYTVRVALQIRTATLADASGGVAYSDAIRVRGGLPPYRFSLLAGTLPDGLTGPGPADGTISGTPIAACTASGTSLTVQVDDDDAPAQSATRAGIGLTVIPAILDITTVALPNARAGVAYNQRVVAAGGVPPYEFEITDGSLPGGLSLNPNNGRIVGTPETAGTRGFEVTVTDSCPETASETLVLAVEAAALGRNDSIATATPLPGDGSYAASISPSGDPSGVNDPDEDYYRITTTAASTITIDTDAEVNGSPIDTVIELLNTANTRLSACGAPAFTSACFNDDEEPGVTLDSRLVLRVNAPATFYIHVVDWASIARPDMLYDLNIEGVQ